MFEIRNLRVEYQKDPLAVGTSRPRFSWELASDAAAGSPSRFRVVVMQNGTIMWDTGARAGGSVGLLDYDGEPLPEGSSFQWSVEVTDADGGAARASAVFETAPDPADWNAAEWITLRRTQYQHDDFRPTPHLRTTVPGRPGVTRARLHITAGGLFEPWVNGKRLDRSSLLPGWTDYNRRVPFHTYDITAEFDEGGDVVLGAILADGWYAGGVGPFHKRAFWGKHPVLRAIVVIDHQDGRRDIRGTDESWEAEFGPIQAADLLQGEVIDARRPLGDWSLGQGKWRRVTIESGPAGVLVPARIRGAAPVAEFAPVSQHQSDPGSVVVDFGQNLAGHVRLHVTGEPGTMIRVRHAEMLSDSGSIYTDNLRGARATDTFILSGSSDVFEPRFTYHGFRYAEITGLPPGATWKVAALAVSSIATMTGELETGHPLVNRLQHNIQWSMFSNFLEVPTDCPSRDERTGWAGDAQIFARTAILNADLGAFFSKWLDDIDDTRMDNGAFPDIAPAVVMDWAREGSSGYAEAGIIVPWVMYEQYGDRRVLEQFFEPGEAWVAYILERSPDLIWRENRNTDYGDWLAPVETRKDLTATAYFARSAQLLARFAEVLGFTGKAAEYHELHKRIAAAFRAEFVSTDGTLNEPTQTAIVLALRFDLLLAEQKEAAFAELVADVEARGHLTTGFLAVAELLPLLSEYGRSDLSYELLLRTDYPSWGHSIEHGATTLWERWDGWRPETGFQDPLMNSFNHFAVGCVGEWLYGALVGVRPTEPGWARIRVAPQLNRSIGRARARLQTIRGRVEVAWHLEGDRVRLDVDVPPGTECEVLLPGEAVSYERTMGKAAPADRRQLEHGHSSIVFAGGSRSFTSRLHGEWAANGTLLSATRALGFAQR